jgi:hypothetical protein
VAEYRLNAARLGEHLEWGRFLLTFETAPTTLMTRTFRQLLATTLLLFICSESTVMATVFPERKEAKANYQLSTTQHELQMVFSFLAEQTEEKAGRDDFSLPVEREVFLPHHFPLISIKCITDWRQNTNTRHTVPIYTSCRTYLI